MKLSENIPGPKALPLLGNILDIGLNSDSKLRMFVCLSIRHERHHGTIRHYDLGETMSYMSQNMWFVITLHFLIGSWAAF